MEHRNHTRLYADAEDAMRRYPNITVRKIPNMLLGRCEFGKDGYSLNIAGLPWRENAESPPDAPIESRSARKSKKPSAKNQQGLFDEEGE